MRIMLGPVIPKEYQEVEYIASVNGNQYIDTSYIPDYVNGFEITIQYALTTRGKRYCLLSSYNQGNAQLSLEVNASNQQRLWFNSGNLDKVIGNATTNKNTAIYIYKNQTWQNNGNNGTTDWTQSGTYTNTISTPTYSMWLFCDRAKRASTFNTPLKLYSCEIKNGNGQLIKKFVPCYHRTNSTIGLYETVEGVFYANAGSGTFTKGNDVLNNFIQCKVPLARIPKEYCEVKYLESTGTQYINTGIAAGVDIGYSLQFQASDLTYSSNADNILLGSRANSKRFWVDYDMSSSNRNLLFGYGNYYRVLLNLGGNTDIFTVNSNIDGNNTGKWVVYQNGIQTATYDASSDNITGNTTTMYLFCANDAGTAKFYSKIRIYSCKIYREGELIQYLVPCYRISDNVIGMYDVIGDQFLTNQGSGTFNKGADKYSAFYGSPALPEYSLMPKTYQRVSYIQCSGTQYINTDYYWTSDITEIDATIDFLSRSAAGQTLYGNEEYINNSNRNFSNLLHGGSNGSFANYCGGSAALSSMTLPSGKGTLQTITSSGNTVLIKWNDTVLVASKTYTRTVNTHNSSMTITNNSGKIYIFSNHNSGTNGANTSPIQLVQSMRLYEFIMYDNGVKVRHFLPCYRCIDQIAGLYDIVEQKFYENNGTGAFTIGAII